MELHFCFLTGEQEKYIRETRPEYTGHDRERLGLLVNDIRDLIRVMEAFALDGAGEHDPYLAIFQLLGHLMRPVEQYFSDLSGAE